MASVYRAEDTRTGTAVALKVLPRAYTVDEEVLQRFKREAEVLEALSHPNIVRFFEDGVDGETHYIAMELVEGRSLESCAASPLDPQQIMEVGTQLSDAVAHLHSKGLVHRDVKPANVVLRPTGQAILVDFGVVHNPSGNLTQAGVGVGSLFYGAPEQLHGEPEPASDIYGLAATLLYALTGREPYDANTPMAQLLKRKSSEGVPSELIGAVPPVLMPLFRSMMAGEPQDRPMPLIVKEEFARDLEGFAQSSASPTLEGSYHDRGRSDCSGFCHGLGVTLAQECIEVTLRQKVRNIMLLVGDFFSGVQSRPVRESERRKFRRIHGPVYTRPAPIRTTLLRVANISLGGVRVYSDVKHRVGKKLEIELFLPDDTSVSCLVEVAWISAPPDDVPAKYEIGVHFMEIPHGGLGKLQSILVDD